MKFSLSWLRDLLDTDASADAIAATLNRIGLEVEGLDDPAARLAGFRVARVLSAAPHPQADKLRVLSVDAGGAAPLQVVCGAANARAGLVGVLGLPGAVVPASGIELKAAAIRGVASHGMMCSSRELGLGDDDGGIVELDDAAPVGAPAAEALGSDPVFDVAITPNRPDCLGVHGIARDLAAAGLGTLKPLPPPSPSPDGEGDQPQAGGGVSLAPSDAPGARETPPPSATVRLAGGAGEDMARAGGGFACPIEIRTDDPAGCPAFHGRVIRGVRNGDSPAWLRARLRSAGQRPISALVDITNYVMLAFGRPAHAYDLARLDGAMVARRAREGERVTALNGRTYALTPAMTVIADDREVHDIAGIMGGEHSGCSATTTDVLLEIAYFDPARIAATGRALGLASDARARFERGVDPGFLDAGMAILTDLVLRLCGGEASAVARAGAPPAARAPVAYDPALAATLGGVAVPEDEQRRTLAALGFAVALGGGGEWTVAAPGWRPDIDGAADIVEEVVRIHGLDRVDSVALPRADGVARPTASPAQKQEGRVRRAAAARGLMEAVTWSFLPAADARLFADDDGAVWTLANPISEDMKTMRPSLLPGLLAAARRNLDRGAAGVRLFEIGRRYRRGPDAEGASDEPPALALVLAGEREPRGWGRRVLGGKAAGFDAFDAKAEALALLAEAGAPVESLQVVPDAGPQFHPGRSATLRLGPKTLLARCGAIHPALARHFDLAAPVAMAELLLDAIPARKRAAGFARARFAPPPLQAVTRDFAFLLPERVPAGDLVRAVKGADKAGIAAARVFDEFRGAGVPEGEKSLAIEVTLQPVDKSYDEAALAAIAARVVAAAGKLGGRLRD